MSLYHESSRTLQDRFDTRRLADRLEQVTVRDHIEERDREFIEARDMFFIATTDADGHPTCSYKGGEPGFVRVLDAHTLAFPNYDGNGMYLTMGNLLANPHVGLLFLDFEGRRRLRLEGTASIADDDPLVAEYPEAQFVVRVRAERVYPNCPRYIHRYRLVERSRFVPKTECETPVPKWKTEQWSADALPDQDPARDPSREVLWKG
jgi:predicted pyridoxine 5'-phosphate oxidase superfamily flavin-nucleotide-binding protein